MSSGSMIFGNCRGKMGDVVFERKSSVERQRAYFSKHKDTITFKRLESRARLAVCQKAWRFFYNHSFTTLPLRKFCKLNVRNCAIPPYEYYLKDPAGCLLSPWTLDENNIYTALNTYSSYPHRDFISYIPNYASVPDDEIYTSSFSCDLVLTEFELIHLPHIKIGEFDGGEAYIIDKECFYLDILPRLGSYKGVVSEIQFGFEDFKKGNISVTCPYETFTNRTQVDFKRVFDEILSTWVPDNLESLVIYVEGEGIRQLFGRNRPPLNFYDALLWVDWEWDITQNDGMLWHPSLEFQWYTLEDDFGDEYIEITFEFLFPCSVKQRQGLGSELILYRNNYVSRPFGVSLSTNVQRIFKTHKQEILQSWNTENKEIKDLETI